MNLTIVIHYSEIGTKGQNRNYFETQLMNNVRAVLDKEIERTYKRHGRIIAELKPSSNLELIKGRLENLPGVSSFSFATQTKLDLEEIKKVSLTLLKKEDFQSFKVKCKRSNKDFPLNSLEVNKELGDYLTQNLKQKVAMDNPDIRLYVEIGEKEAFLYCHKHLGVGGLPVDASGKVICSLSGGIDSPVASFLLMKRGCRVIFVHIYNKTQGGESVLSKIQDLVERLTRFQHHSKLYIVSFEKIQKEIILKIPSSVRMIIYRRFMMKIINEIAKKEKAKGIITGDSIGQVASQTLDNLKCIYHAAELPVFSPLCGMNKEEIITIAKKIGTFELSIQPYPDCCSFMIAQHPETKADLEQIKQIEKQLENEKELIEESIKNAEIKKY